MNQLGKLIEELRTKKGFSQRQLALYSGISNTEISKLESGERQKPNPNILKKIAPYLGTTFDNLMIAAGYTNEDINIQQQYETELIELASKFTVEELEKVIEIKNGGLSILDIYNLVKGILKSKQ